MFAAPTGKGKARQLIVNPLSPVTSLTPGKVLAALRAQFGTRSGNALNKDRKNLVAAWNWGVKYLGLPMPNPCLVERFPEERHLRYIPSEEDFWKVYAQACGQDRIMLLCYLHLGARRSEIFRLAWEDANFDNSRVRLYTREYDWLPRPCGWWWENRTFPDSTSVRTRLDCAAVRTPALYGGTVRMDFYKALWLPDGNHPVQDGAARVRQKSPT